MAFSSFLEKIFGSLGYALEMLGWLLGHLAVILTAWLVGVGSLEGISNCFSLKLGDWCAAWRQLFLVSKNVSKL